MAKQRGRVQRKKAPAPHQNRPRRPIKASWDVEISFKRAIPRLDRVVVRQILQSLLTDLEHQPPKGVRSRGHLPFPPPSVRQISLSFIGDSLMRELNRTHRKKDKSTDVLSFAALEASDYRELASDEVKYPLGDIVISLDTAIVQARRYRWGLGQEILRLLIHGTLHLLGYDHEGVAPKEAERMRRLERRLFSRYRQEAPAIVLAGPSPQRKNQRKSRK